MLGPQRSMSSTPTVKSSLVAKHLAIVAVTVLFPTPPCRVIIYHSDLEVAIYFSRQDQHNILDTVQVPGNELDIGIRCSWPSRGTYRLVWTSLTSGCLKGKSYNQCRERFGSRGRKEFLKQELSFTLPLSSVPVPGQASGGGSTKLMTFCNLCLIMFDQVDQKDPAEHILHSLIHLIVEACT